MGWDGIGTLLGKLSTFIPGRVEKIKNERERLLDEKNTIESKPFTIVGSKRVFAINERVRQIDSILRNNARD